MYFMTRRRSVVQRQNVKIHETGRGNNIDLQISAFDVPWCDCSRTYFYTCVTRWCRIVGQLAISLHRTSSAACADPRTSRKGSPARARTRSGVMLSKSIISRRTSSDKAAVIARQPVRYHPEPYEHETYVVSFWPCGASSRVL